MASQQNETSLQSWFEDGQKLSIQFFRNNDKPLDVSSVFPNKELADEYARNAGAVNYAPYNGQVIAVTRGSGKGVYMLEESNEDFSADPILSRRGHFRLEKIVGGATIEGGYISAEHDDDNNGHTLQLGDLVIKKDTNPDDPDASTIQNGGRGSGSLFVEGETNIGGPTTINNTLTVNGNATVTGEFHANGGFSSDGDSTFENLQVTGKADIAEVESDNLHGKDTPGSTGGWSLGKDPNDGRSKLVLDDVMIRGALKAMSVEIQEAYFVGGMMILTVGMGFVCSGVENGYVTSSGQRGYKCYFQTGMKDGYVLKQLMRVGDLALCQTFNLDSGNRYYWRAVIEVGENYTVLSETEGVWQDGSGGIPAAGDKIVHCGNYDPTSGRDKATVIASVQSGISPQCPAVLQYQHINTFAWPDAETVISPDGNKFTGSFQAVDAVGDKHDLLQISEQMQVNLQELNSRQDNVFQIHLVDFRYVAADWSDPATAAKMEPEKNWPTNAEKQKHIGDFAVTSDGFCLKYQYSDSAGFYWRVVTDKYLQQAMTLIVDAQAKINQIVDDNEISPTEKTQLQREWQSVEADWNTLWNKGLKYVSNAQFNGLRQESLQSFNDLKVIMGVVLSDMNRVTSLNDGNISIGGKTYNFKRAWMTYYSAYESLRVSTDNQIRLNIDDTTDVANSASTAAKKAEATLLDISDDDKITKQEVSQLQDLWSSMAAQYKSVKTDADKYSVNITPLTDTYRALDALITKIADTVTEESPYIISANAAADKYEDTWSSFLSLLDSSSQSVSAAAKTAVDNAKDAADKAKKAAGDAAKAAADANTAADKANDSLAEIALDTVITIYEHNQLSDTWDSMVAQYDAASADATKYGVDITALTSAKTALGTLIETVLNLDKDYTITADYNTKWDTFFAALKTARENIVTAAEKKAADAQDAADKANKWIDSNKNKVTEVYNDMYSEGGKFLVMAGELTKVSGAVTKLQESGFVGANDFAKVFSKEVLLDPDGTKTIEAYVQTKVEDHVSTVEIGADQILMGGSTYLSSIFAVDTTQKIVKIGGFEVHDNWLGIKPTGFTEETASNGNNISVSSDYGFYQTYKAPFLYRAVRIDAANTDDCVLRIDTTSGGAARIDGEVFLNTSTGGLFAHRTKTVIGGLHIADFITVTNEFSLGTPSSDNSGRVLFVKGTSGSSKVVGSIISSSVADEVPSVTIGKESHIFICDGTHWIDFDCSN